MKFERAVKNKNQKQDSGVFPLWKLYEECAPRKKQYHCFFDGAPRVSSTNDLHIQFG